MVKKIPRRVKKAVPAPVVQPKQSAKSGFRLLDLPSELIEDICGVLVEQNRQRSLANLNIGNKFLRELTKRFLWENVRWTPKTWNHKLYLREGVPEIFVHIKTIMLVSPFPDPNNGWDHGDKEFWEPLIDISMTTDNTRSFGQCISDIFPNVRYVAAVCAPPAKLRSDTNKTASIYVSDRHIIRKSDTAAMRKMIFDTVGEIRQGRNVPRTFADFEQGPEFEADRMNMPDFDGTYYALQEALKQPGRVTLPEERTMIEFEPFRNVATIILDDMLLKLHVMSTVKPQAMVGKMRGKVIDIFSVLRRVVAMEGDEVRVKRLKLALHAEADPARPADVPYFQIVREWMNDLSSHPPLVNKNNLPESLFDLSVASAHRSTLPEFKKKCVQFHEALSAIHSASPTGANTALPTCILFHGFDIARPDEASCFFARMDFSTPELATAVFFGRMHADEEGYRVSSCYQHGQKVQDREALERLNELMIRAGSE